MVGMLAGRKYKFNIVNFEKCGSLYNEGMRPLLYSEAGPTHVRPRSHSGSCTVHLPSWMDTTTPAWTPMLLLPEHTDQPMSPYWTSCVE